jgi:hypothetical protein
MISVECRCAAARMRRFFGKNFSFLHEKNDHVGVCPLSDDDDAWNPQHMCTQGTCVSRTSYSTESLLEDLELYGCTVVSHWTSKLKGGPFMLHKNAKFILTAH